MTRCQAATQGEAWERAEEASAGIRPDCVWISALPLGHDTYPVAASGDSSAQWEEQYYLCPEQLGAPQERVDMKLFTCACI